MQLHRWRKMRLPCSPRCVATAKKVIICATGRSRSIECGPACCRIIQAHPQNVQRDLGSDAPAPLVPVRPRDAVSQAGPRLLARHACRPATPAISSAASFVHSLCAHRTLPLAAPLVGVLSCAQQRALASEPYSTFFVAVERSVSASRSARLDTPRRTEKKA